MVSSTLQRTTIAFLFALNNPAILADDSPQQPNRLRTREHSPIKDVYETADGNSHPSTNGNNRGRRVGPLGKASPNSALADCSTSGIDIQLFPNSPDTNYHFNPNPASCRSGRTFVGTSSDGRMQINLVPGHAHNAAGEQTIAASINDLETGVVYSIGGNEVGDLIVEERTQEDYPDEADPEEDGLLEYDVGGGEDQRLGQRALGSEDLGGGGTTQPFSTGLQLRGNSKNSNNFDSRSLVSAGNTVMDVLVVWTKKAECRNSGLSAGCTLTSTTEANMLARINLAISETNTAFTLSGVTAELDLVHAYREPKYVESSGFGTALSHLRGKSDGNIDGVHAKRTQYGADLVAMIIDDSRYCGIAYMGPNKAYMFSVTAWNCATGYYSFGHELGHNMGLDHDRGTTNSCENTNDYNYGYRDQAGNFRSILAYSCRTGQCDNNQASGCTRVQRFSNIAKQYNGKAIGKKEANNARKINDVKDTVAAYYPTVTETTSTTSTTTSTTTTTTSTTTTQPPPTTTTTTTTTVTTSPPSQSPTHFPSTSPSKAPSMAPSLSPVRPTSPPTQVRVTMSPPSQSPTRFPSTSPSKAPSMAPSQTPVRLTTPPTQAPTNQPTLSSMSSEAPSKSPSRSPTNQPANAFIQEVNCNNYNNGGACKADTNCQWRKGICKPSETAAEVVCTPSRMACDDNCCSGSCHVNGGNRGLCK